jgi:dihydropteroate synthase
MGILNLTPDSFSDGGRFPDPASAVEHGVRLAREGAAILDLGGESTRPGAQPVSVQQELDRVMPVLERLRPEVDCLISVDTTKSEVAREAIRLGTDLINDISGLHFDPEMAGVIGGSGVGVVLMHTRGRPAWMQQLPPSPDIFREVREGWRESIRRAESAGIGRGRILLDPGIGFGKTVRDNLLLINRLSEFAEFGLPLLVGPSRKSFIGHILNRPPDERVLGTAAACAASILRGAHVLRVHDVAEMVQVVRIVDSILAEEVIRRQPWGN